MKTTTRILLILGAAGALALAASLLVPGTSRGANPTLNAFVGPDSGFAISLKDAGGNSVTQLDPGTYDIKVDDEGTIHNFHLSGPGVDKATNLEGTGTTTWTVTFVDGTYTFQCDAHPNIMHGSFTVGTPPPPPPPPPKPKVLKGSVGPGHTISLKKSGAAVHRLKHGKYILKVRDRSSKLNFHLKGPTVNKKTGISFTGKKTWKIRVRAGTYKYRSDGTKHLKKKFRVF